MRKPRTEHGRPTIIFTLRCLLRSPVSFRTGSSNATLVELPGIEPGSYGIPSRLLRAQFAMPLLGSPGHAN
jgi:hypothetical protein